MQLRNARLCLDCEEVHDALQCPACASETFAFITRWVPAPERRAGPRPPEPSRAAEAETLKQLLTSDKREATGTQWMKRGALGLALFGVAGWMWRRSARPEGESEVSAAETLPD